MSLDPTITAIVESVDDEMVPTVSYQRVVLANVYEHHISTKEHEIEKLRQRVLFLESDAIKVLEKKLELHRSTAGAVYRWLDQFAKHPVLGKSWCGLLDDSFGAMHRMWKGD